MRIRQLQERVWARELVMAVHGRLMCEWWMFRKLASVVGMEWCFKDVKVK